MTAEKCRATEQAFIQCVACALATSGMRVGQTFNLLTGGTGFPVGTEDGTKLFDFTGDGHDRYTFYPCRVGTRAKTRKEVIEFLADYVSVGENFGALVQHHMHVKFGSSLNIY
jgi:hypothetical protein